MKDQICDMIREALASLGDTVPPEARDVTPTIERTRDSSHGDFASNIALVLAKRVGKPPREFAALLVAALPASPLVERTEIAGPGFINFFMTSDATERTLLDVLEAGEHYGRSEGGKGTRVLVEFVSANPTGPLHVGHGRGAAYGDSVAALLEATGHDVHREYYVNDAGRQMDILAASTWLRYLELCGEALRFPSNGYRGGYVIDMAKSLQEACGEALHRPATAVMSDLPKDTLGDGEAASAEAGEDGDKEAHIDALIGRARSLLGADGYRQVFRLALDIMLDDIRDDLGEFGVEFDEWFSEQRLADEALVQRALDRLKDNDELYQKDGATWFRATRYGDDKDRVVVRDNGQTTYIASDIAYHLNKRERGFDILLDVLGADHHGYVARVRAGLAAMGEPADSLDVQLLQFVALYEGQKKIAMGTRGGKFVTLRELRRDVGNDVARFFYIMRSHDQHLDFDLELARTQSDDNPVHYVQYAHARMCSIFRQLEEQGLSWDEAGASAHVDQLNTDHERALIATLGRFPEVVARGADKRAPQVIANYLRDLARDFHGFYNACKVLVDDPSLRDARLVLVAATRQVVANGLTLLGVSAPQSM